MLFVFWLWATKKIFLLFLRMNSNSCNFKCNHTFPFVRKATFSFISSLLSFLWKRQFERREKNEKRKVKRTKRNDNLLSKIVVSFWQRNRDSNPNKQSQSLSC